LNVINNIMIYTTINYSEGNKKNLGYKSVEIHFGKDEKKFFDTGNFVKDWWDRTKFIIQELLEDGDVFVHSSSVDHFIMDGAPYDSAYLHVVDEKPVLKYVDMTDPDYLFTQADIFEKGTEMFVPEGTKPTWEELKEICK
jgi:hypothetical protein